jgi:hypothetical protein
MHFHNRGVRNLIQKCRRDIFGLKLLNQIDDINNIELLKSKIGKQVIGSHNILTYVQYLQYGPSSLCVYDDECIKIENFGNKIAKVRLK